MFQAYIENFYLYCIRQVHTAHAGHTYVARVWHRQKFFFVYIVLINKAFRFYGRLLFRLCPITDIYVSF